MRSTWIWMSLIAMASTAHAVTIVSSTSTASTTVGATTDTTPPTSQSFASGTGAVNSVATSLSLTNNTPNSFQYSLASSSTTSIVRTNGGGGPVAGVSSFIQYQIQFALGINEEADVVFDFTYNMVETSIEGQIQWGLTGPSGGIGALSNTVTTAGTGSFSNSSTPLRLVQQGTYVFTLTGTTNVTNQSINPNQNVTINFNTASFSVVSVPEPGVTLLGMLGLGVLVMRRRRP